MAIRPLSRRSALRLLASGPSLALLASCAPQAPTQPTAYVLADRTYGEPLRQLHQHKFRHLTPALRQTLLSYFASGIPVPTRETDRDDDNAREARKYRRKTQEALAALRALPG